MDLISNEHALSRWLMCGKIVYTVTPWICCWCMTDILIYLITYHLNLIYMNCIIIIFKDYIIPVGAWWDFNLLQRDGTCQLDYVTTKAYTGFMPFVVLVHSLGMRLLPRPVAALCRQASGLASFPGSPGMRIFIEWRAWYLSTPAQLQCSRFGAWEPGNETTSG